jgi:hypothetical protein
MKKVRGKDKKKNDKRDPHSWANLHQSGPIHHPLRSPPDRDLARAGGGGGLTLGAHRHPLIACALTPSPLTPGARASGLCVVNGSSELHADGG